MWLILLFRICILFGFLFTAWKWGDWKNWQKYYSSMLFVALVNMSAGYLSYHHSLWIFAPDALVSTQTVVEFINTYIALPTTTLIYLSHFPSGSNVLKVTYIVIATILYATLEWFDHMIIGGISYDNGWSLSHSAIFDFFMFTTIRLHHTRPLLAWVAVLIGTTFILLVFNFGSGKMK